jgi:hypothetical protein
MKKAKQDFCFPFYFQRYLSGTMGFDVEQHGAYLLAMIYQFQNGHFSEASINRVIGGKFEIIKHKYEIDEDGLYFNETMEEVIVDRKRFIETKRNNRLGKTRDSLPINGSSSVVPLQGGIDGSGSKGVVKKKKDNTLFNKFYEVYPKKVSKIAALKAWDKIDPKPTEEFTQMVVDKVIALTASPRWTEDNGKYRLNPATWLNAGGWSDEVEKTTDRDLSQY